MSNYEFLPLEPSHNQQMLAVMEASPMRGGGLELYFDKSPDVFAATKMKYVESLHLGIFQQGKLQGGGSIGYYDALVQGQQARVFTFYNVYLIPEARGKRLTEQLMQKLYARIRGNADYGLALSLKGNRAIETYVGRILGEGLPPVRIIDEWIVKSILFSFPKRNNTAYSVRNAKWEDVPAIVKLLDSEYRQRDFGLIFSEEMFGQSLLKRGLVIEDYYVALDKSGSIQGVCLAWNCHSFRRTVVRKFSPAFYPSLWAYRLMAPLLRMADFPQSGECFRELTITDYAVTNRDPVIMHALLCEIYHRNRTGKYHFMNFGSCGNDPLLQAATGFWHRNIASNIIFGSLKPGNTEVSIRMPYIDIAFL